MILNNFKSKSPQDINGINTYLQYISRNGIVPHKMKLAKNNSNTTTFNNFEEVFCNRVISLLVKTGYFSCHQCGLRNQLSTVYAVTELTELVTHAFKNNKRGIVVFIDLKKVSDIIHYEILIYYNCM